MARKDLEKIVENEPRTYEAEPHKSFMQKYIATPLRYFAGGLYAAAPVSLIYGGAGFGLSALGVGASALADAIDFYSYNQQGRLSMKHGGFWKALGEGIATKPLGYLPIGTGLIDVYRGSRKFQSRLEETAQEEPRIIKLDRFKDDRYLEPRMKKAA